MNFEPPEDSKDLICFHASSGSDWLRLGPMKIQSNSHNPYHAVIKELIFRHECDGMRKPLGRKLDKRRTEDFGKPSKYHEWADLRVMKK